MRKRRSSYLRRSLEETLSLGALRKMMKMEEWKLGGRKITWEQEEEKHSAKRGKNEGKILIWEPWGLFIGKGEASLGSFTFSKSLYVKSNSVFLKFFLKFLCS